MMPMRTASILLAFVTLLAAAKPAVPQGPVVKPRIILSGEDPVFDHTTQVAGWTFGFDERENLLKECPIYTTLYAGPAGSYEVPFTARQALIGCSRLLPATVLLAHAARPTWRKFL